MNNHHRFSWADVCTLLAILFHFSTPSTAIPTEANLTWPDAGNAANTHCVSSGSWLTRDFDITDCDGAGELFEKTDYATYTTKRLEFGDRGAKSQIITPRYYKFETCTIVVSMLWSFPNGDVIFPPGEAKLPLGPYSTTTVTSYEDIYRSLNDILGGCKNLKQTPVGWEIVGDDENIGVFVMATESVLEGNFPTNWKVMQGLEHFVEYIHISNRTRFSS